ERTGDRVSSGDANADLYRFQRRAVETPLLRKLLIGRSERDSHAVSRFASMECVIGIVERRVPVSRERLAIEMRDHAAGLTRHLHQWRHHIADQFCEAGRIVGETFGELAVSADSTRQHADRARLARELQQLWLARDSIDGGLRELVLECVFQLSLRAENFDTA